MLIDAVLGVGAKLSHLFALPLTFFSMSQHRLGGDKTEVFEAIPVEANNRLRPKGPPRDIKVSQHKPNLHIKLTVMMIGSYVFRVPWKRRHCRSSLIDKIKIDETI